MNAAAEALRYPTPRIPTMSKIPVAALERINEKYLTFSLGLNRAKERLRLSITPKA
jgi:hypothetical protein